MKNREPANGDSSSKSFSFKKKKNLQRLAGRSGGGGGLSLETFANIKSTTNNNNNYNPSIIKKKREFYKNAKYVSKFKKQLKQENYQPQPSLAFTEDRIDAGEASESMKRNKKNGPHDDGNGSGEGRQIARSNKKNKEQKNPYSLKQLYEKQREEAEKVKMEKDVIFKAKQVERARAEAKRKATKEVMFKKTRHGQPVMKYRIEHLLQSIQGSNGSSES
ncbi:hypothetical protein LINGRAHAP2_LOCUS20045 [Linum grandiflorum]